MYCDFKCLLQTWAKTLRIKTLWGFLKGEKHNEKDESSEKIGKERERGQISRPREGNSKLTELQRKMHVGHNIRSWNDARKCYVCGRIMKSSFLGKCIGGCLHNIITLNKIRLIRLMLEIKIISVFLYHFLDFQTGNENPFLINGFHSYTIA